MDPNSAIARLLVGLSSLKKGDAARAIVELEQIKAADPGAWYQRYLGYACAKLGLGAS